MNMGRGFIHGLLLSSLLTLFGCSGSSSGDGDLAGGGTGGTGSTVAVSRGPISAIGSIWVNGVEYDTTGATITIPGQEPFEDSDGTAGGSDLLQGMLVTVRGSINADGVSGTAESVTYSRSLLGQVSGHAGNTFMVYGQQVVIDDLTRFEPAATTTGVPLWFGNDQWVEVSGFVLDGTVRATFIKQLTLQSEVEIEGTVTAFDANTAVRTLTVGGTVVFVPADVTFPALTANVSYVEVHAEAPAAGSTSLTANEVSVQDTGLGGEDGDEAEVEGVITALLGATASGPTGFVIAGQEVALTTATQVSGGLLTDLTVGMRVEAEGVIDAAGRLVADEISFEDSIEVQEQVAIVSDANHFRFTTGNIAVELDPVLTEGYSEVQPAAGDIVRVRGRVTEGVIVATNIERVSPPTLDAVEVEIQGPVENINLASQSFVILGTEFPISEMTLDLDEQEDVPPATFFAELAVGDLVAVSGLRTSGQITWEEAELEE